VIDDAITLKRLGRHVQQQGTMVELLVGIAVEGMAGEIGIAGNRESRPTEKQLHRFVDELAAAPPPGEMERKWLAHRYFTLDPLQAMAHGRELLAEHLSIWDDNEDYSPGITVSLPLDWNVIMRRMNAAYDNMGNVNARLPSQRRSPGDIFLGVRSRHVAEYLTCVFLSSNSAFLEARRRTSCSNNLRRIALALLLYEREHGTLPPACKVDAQGKPLHSWRVLLLPHVGEAELFAHIRLDEPWNSEHNRQFHDAAVDVYQCPSANLMQGDTAYSVIVGERTAFQPGEGRLRDEDPVLGARWHGPLYPNRDHCGTHGNPPHAHGGALLALLSSTPCRESGRADGIWRMQDRAIGKHFRDSRFAPTGSCACGGRATGFERYRGVGSGGRTS